MKKLLLVTTLLALLALSVAPMVLAQQGGGGGGGDEELFYVTPAEGSSAPPLLYDPAYEVDAGGDLKIYCGRVSVDMLQFCLDNGVTPREITDENGNILTTTGSVQYDNEQ